LPALRERKADILPLVRYFTDRLLAREGITPRPLDEEAQAMLLEYAWPGNVRELENCMSRALLLSTADSITKADIEGFLKQTHYTESSTDDAHISLLKANGIRKTMKEIEDEVIARTLAHYGNAVPKAAATLELGQSTLYRKLSDKKTG
jgi:DNA-binding NtrC family response regulator